MTPEDTADELTYRNYRFNRKLFPEIEVKKWELIYGPKAIDMEVRFATEAALGGFPDYHTQRAHYAGYEE